MKLDRKLQERLSNLIRSMGYELVGCEMLPQGRQMLLRIYIDSKNGITVDDCSKVSYQVGAMMDVEDAIRSRYTLEVSSPGINRPLFEIGQYQKYLGKRVKIRLRLPINQRRQFKGELKKVEGENIHLLVGDDDVGEQEVVIPFALIEKANLIEDVFGKGQKTKGSKRKN